MQLMIASHEIKKNGIYNEKKKIRQVKPTQIWNTLELTDMDIKMVNVTMSHRFQKREKIQNVLLKLGKCF